MSTVRSLIAVSLFVSAITAVAKPPVTALTAEDSRIDSVMASHKYIYFGEGTNPSQDSVAKLIYHFYYDQFRQFQDPLAPYFLFMSRDANLAMGIGGRVRMRGYCDWGGSVNTPAFSPLFIPTAADPLHRRLLDTTPAGTALFFRVIGMNKKLGLYQLYIEADFSGYQSRDFKLKKAYAEINSWTIGYATSSFGDGSAVPPTIDSNGPVMKMDATAVLLRWMHTCKSRFTVAASVETPSMTVQNDGTHTAACSQYLPNLAGFIQYGWGRDQHIRLSAIARFLPYRDLLNASNHTLTGWGLQLSSKFAPIAPLTLYATVNAGKSYANYGGNMMMGPYDLVEDISTPGRLRTVPSVGWFVGAMYTFSPQFFATTTWAQGRYLPNFKVPGSDYKYGLYSATNLFWNLTPRIQAGVEFNIGKRQNFDGTHGWARRIGLLAMFSF